jgi:phosphotransferase system enzyme I (PtsP)
MRGSLTGPRVLLRRLREVMAEPVGAQERLDRIVVLIAANMVAEVCSIYVLRENETLELFATHGLKAEAVHHSRLKVGQGLVGLIAADAEPLSLTDAQSHPAFAYLPETGEEIYHSFLGVPILRSGHTLGVLVVQNQALRSYSEEEIEALQTTAMVLAEMIASGELAVDAAPEVDLRHTRPHHVSGLPLSEGIGLGHVVLHEPRIPVTTLIAENIEEETQRLDQALERLKASIDDMLERRELPLTGEHRDVLEAYRMFAHDRGWARRLREAVGSGLTAEAAVERVQNDYRARLMRQTDPYLRERLHDLEDLANRLMRELAGSEGEAELPADAIIVARTMGAAELLDYDRERVRGLVLEEGGPTSHVTVVARALGIPTVGRADDVRDLVDEGDPIIVDGVSGEVHVRPPADVEAAYVEKVRFRAKRQAQFRRLRDKPAVTRDGVAIRLLINGGLLVDLPHLWESGAEGIGLYRTELQFMVSATLPRMNAQMQTYRAVLDAAGEKPVTFRALDIGGDKVVPYLRSAQEENPALGWRAIRLALDRPGLLRTQLRALLHAAAGRELRLMFPMISDVSEFEQARALVEREKAHFLRHSHALPTCLQLGVMIEVPAVLWSLDRLLQHVDFAAVGSNDLMQFLFAADRGNTRMSNRFDPLLPSGLKALKHIADTAARHGTPLTLCGEMASRPLEAMTLLALGYRGISMTPAAIGPIKAMIRSLDLGRLSELVAAHLDGEGCLRPALASFAERHKIPV